MSEDQINDLISKEKDEHESVGSFIQRINAVIGTPEIIKNKIHEYIEIGVEKFIIHFVSLDSQSLRLFSSGVMTKNYKGPLFLSQWTSPRYRRTNLRARMDMEENVLLGKLYDRP